MKRLIAILCAAALVLALCACGQEAKTDETQQPQQQTKTLSAIFEEVKAQVALSDMVEYTDVSKLDRYYGITADKVTEFAGCVNSSGTNQEEIVLIKAADSAAADEIQQILENKYNAKLNENKDYNPEQAAMIEKCKVERDDLYVSMIISPSADQITAIYKDGIAK